MLNTAAEQSERNAEKDKNGENLDDTAKSYKLEGKGATKVINVIRVKSFKSNGKSNIFRQSFGVKRMARQAGQIRARGFNYTSKSVRQREVWPYPGPKASFHVMWKYKLSLCEERNLIVCLKALSHLWKVLPLISQPISYLHGIHNVNLYKLIRSKIKLYKFI